MISCCLRQTKTTPEWDEVLKDMNTDEVLYGSVWKERRPDPEDPEQPVERLLVKWKGMSYMHLTWELEEDLLDQLGPPAKVAIQRFRTRIQTGEELFYEELRDNEYFPPSYLQVRVIGEIIMLLRISLTLCDLVIAAGEGGRHRFCGRRSRGTRGRKHRQSSGGA